MSKYLTPDLTQRLATGAPAQRLDAGETAMVARSLEHVEQRVLETVVAELRALKYIPTIAGIDPGARLYTWYRATKVGEAVRTGDRGKDLPRVDAKLEAMYSTIGSYGASYGYTVQELREIALAARNGINLQLDTLRTQLAAEVIARKIDNVVAFGDPDDATIKGALNNPEVTVGAAAGVWSGLTAQQLVDELFALANVQLLVSKETMMPDTILLPTTQLLLVQKMPYGINNDRSVLSYFMQSMRDAQRTMNIASWPVLALADAELDGPRAVSYRRDENVIGAIVPMPFQSQPPQAEGLEFIVPCEGICGGAVVKQPLGVYYRDGL